MASDGAAGIPVVDSAVGIADDADNKAHLLQHFSAVAKCGGLKEGLIRRLKPACVEAGCAKVRGLAE